MLHFAVTTHTKVAICNCVLSLPFRNCLSSRHFARLVRRVHWSFVMRIAISHWLGHVAPVFDVAGHLLLVDVEGGRVIRREEKPLTQIEPAARASELIACGVDLLVCGAISAPLQLRIAGTGVRIVAFLCGTVSEVLSACLSDTLADPRLAMPGCRRWRWHGGEDALPAGIEPGRGIAAGRGRGRFGQGRGMGRGPAAAASMSAAAADAFSTCPRCGAIVRRKEGPDRVQTLCSRCGTAMEPL